MKKTIISSIFLIAFGASAFGFWMPKSGFETLKIHNASAYPVEISEVKVTSGSDLRARVEPKQTKFLSPDSGRIGGSDRDDFEIKIFSSKQEKLDFTRMLDFMKLLSKNASIGELRMSFTHKEVTHRINNDVQLRFEIIADGEHQHTLLITQEDI